MAQREEEAESVVTNGKLGATWWSIMSRMRNVGGEEGHSIRVVTW